MNPAVFQVVGLAVSFGLLGAVIAHLREQRDKARADARKLRTALENELRPAITTVVTDDDPVQLAGHARLLVGWINMCGGEARFLPDGWDAEPGMVCVAVRAPGGWAYASPRATFTLTDVWFDANENCPPPAGRKLRIVNIEEKKS